MLITAPCVVSLTWHLADAQGQTIDDLTEPLEFFFGGHDLLPKLEECLTGQRAGFATDLHLEPENGFGDYDPALVCFEERALFPGHLEQGMQFDGLPEGAATTGMKTDAIYTITEIYPSHLVLDGNHPLAGMALRLSVKVHAVREATEEEAAAQTLSESALSVLSTAPPSPHLH
jgi:FKBP-type peptidyl-prolyl cis-trans isomerase SlyD